MILRLFSFLLAIKKKAVSVLNNILHDFALNVNFLKTQIKKKKKTEND